MAMRSIICLFDGMEQEFSALETAIGMAKSAAADLRIVHVIHPLSPAVTAGGAALLIESEFLEVLKHSREQLAEAARKAAVELCARHQLRLDGNGHSLPKATFVSVRADATSLARELSLCDIIVLGADTNDDLLARGSVDVALFHSGRSILIVRPRPSDTPPRLAGGSCAIAWNGTPEATRALINARPIIEEARQVFLLVTDDATSGESARSRAAAHDYLAAYGIEAKVEIVDHGDGTAAEAVLERARKLECDVFVMGAYGHSVFREMILGGFSEHMVKNCEIPLVMCH